MNNLKTLGTVLLLLTAIAMKAQVGTTKSYRIDVLENPTLEQNATYLRKGVKSDSLWIVTDYYLSSTQPRMKTFCTDDQLQRKQGPCVYYYKSGKVLAEGRFESGKKQGLWKSYYASGRLLESVTYLNDVPTGVAEGFFESGSLSYKNTFDSAGRGEGLLIHYYQSGIVRDSGRCENNQRTGKWLFYRENKSKASEIEFRNNEVTASRFYDTDGTSITPPKAEVEALYPEGEAAWTDYLRNKILAVYKKKNYARMIGSCTMQFIVDTDGRLTSIEAIESNNPLLEAYVTELLETSRKWIPAQQFNLPVKAWRRQKFTITPPQ